MFDNINYEQTAALRDYYENMTDEDTHERAIKRYEFFSKKVSPMLALTFVGIYWLGIYH